LILWRFNETIIDLGHIRDGSVIGMWPGSTGADTHIHTLADQYSSAHSNIHSYTRTYNYTNEDSPPTDTHSGLN
jgi:hypothetical protein